MTAGHVLAMAASRDGKFAISNPFFGAEKRMAPAESYCRIGVSRIYDRGELVFPDVIEVFHPQVITMGKSYTMPFYSGIKENGVVVINSDVPLLSDEDVKRLKDLDVAVFYIKGTGGVGSGGYGAFHQHDHDRVGGRHYQMRLPEGTRGGAARAVREKVRGLRWNGHLG